MSTNHLRCSFPSRAMYLKRLVSRLQHCRGVPSIASDSNMVGHSFLCMLQVPGKCIHSRAMFNHARLRVTVTWAPLGFAAPRKTWFTRDFDRASTLKSPLSVEEKFCRGIPTRMHMHQRLEEVPFNPNPNWTRIRARSEAGTRSSIRA